MKNLVICIGSADILVEPVRSLLERLGDDWNVKIIREQNITARRTYKIIRGLLLKRGLLYTLDFILLKLLELFRQSHGTKHLHLHFETTDLNSLSAIHYINSCNPEYIICAGISILSKNTLRALCCAPINIHPGINPKYRGNGSIWALANNDFEHIGYTVHAMTEKIDSGQVILRDQIPKNIFKNKLYSDFEKIIYSKAFVQLTEYLLNGKKIDRFSSTSLESKFYNFAGFSIWRKGQKAFEILSKER